MDLARFGEGQFSMERVALYASDRLEGLSLQAILEFLILRAPKATDLRVLVKEALDFYVSNEFSRPVDLFSLARQLRQQVQAEEEGRHSPASVIVSRVPITLEHSLEVHLIRVAEQYLDSTKYLVPIMAAFAWTGMQFRRPDGSVPALYIALRDGLCFATAFLAFARREGQDRVHFQAYSRLHSRLQARPRYLKLVVEDAIAPVLEMTPGALLIDVGLYGSLVRHMLEGGIAPADLGVYFLGSRNPNLAGFLNLLLAPSVVSSNRSVDPLDIIRVADSAESLLKPMIFTQQLDQDGSLGVALSDPISFICSASFYWALYSFALQWSADQEIEEEVFNALKAGKANPLSWVLRKPVERWSEAESFVKSWAYGPLFPMKQLCGLDLE